MKKWSCLPIAIMLLTLPGCKAIGDIFKAGVWVGIIIVVVIIGLIVFLVGRKK